MWNFHWKLTGWAGLFASIFGLVSVGSVSAGHSLEDVAERIEDKTDDLQDVIEDHFERSPNYRVLAPIACRLERNAEELDEAIEDCHWSCAQDLLTRMHADVHSLAELVAVQDPCHVSVRSMSKAAGLITEIDGTICHLEQDLWQVAPPVVVPPVPTDPARYPAYRLPNQVWPRQFFGIGPTPRTNGRDETDSRSEPRWGTRFPLSVRRG